jgi:hypothetical protein
MDYRLAEILAAEKARDFTRVDPRRATAIELALRPGGLRGLMASALVRVATTLDSNVVRPAASR